MARTTALKALVCGCLLLCVFTSPAWADPTAAQMLSFKPSQDVHITTPTADELATCEVQAVKNAKGNKIGWLLLDAKKQPLRGFIDSNGDNKIDIWSYYKDGVEVYREVDSNFNGRPDQFRWLNSAGMKWGISTKEDGKIDVWRMISSEEVAQEIFLALSARDLARLEALFISESDMRALKMPAAEIDRIGKQQKQAAAKFQAVLAKIPGLDIKAKFLRVEAIGPTCIPSESFGGEQDVIKTGSRAILFETAGPKKAEEWIQSGEMIQVGLAWRLIEGPDLQNGNNPQAAANQDNLKMRPFLEKLAKLDDDGRNINPNDKDGIRKYNIERADLIEKILPVDETKNSESWTKQIIDNLSAAAQTEHAPSLQRLKQWHEDLERKLPGTSLAAYAVFRELSAIYGPQLNNPKLAPKEFAKIQEEWHEKLAKFVQTYSTADDTPDALRQLAMNAEFNGKDEEAKRWNEHIVKHFATHHSAEGAKGALNRLNLVGNQLELSGPQLGSGENFNITKLKGKLVAVYYWASNVDVCERDFDTFRRLQKDYGAKGFELVCVSLDDKAEDATKFLQRNKVQSIHLFQAAKDGVGISSPFAVQYGINGLPTLFLVGRDGKVINRSLQVGELEPELKKAL
ncbi:MAG: TlpA family protein disulfide reductase [Planctomycetes bacterium]|nr:TlpA family protein disulfide reductase [Planctomycetota bacterium]